MRPSDEHQHQSKRPNLFSSSRTKTGGEHHILARLEAGMPAASHGAAPRRAHPAMLGGAAVLVIGLIGTLAMLAGSQPPAPRPMEASAPTLAASSASPPSQPHVTILDESPAPAVGPALVTLAPEPELAAPALAVAALTSASAVPAAPRRRALAPEPLRTAFKTQIAVARPAPAKLLRRAAPVQTEVDPDVALLSVILAQTARHSSKGYGEGDCGTRRKPCTGTKF